MSAIARLDASMARRVGEMLVTQDEPDFERTPELALLNLKSLTAGELLAQYASKQASYQTAPFDVTGEQLRFYPGGISIWSGFPGSGKTTLLRQLACHLLHRGEGVFFASLEEHPSDLLIGIAAVAAGVPLGFVPDEKSLQIALDAYSDRLRIWGVIGIAQHRKILGVIRKLGEQGIKHAIIDSLMCLDIRNDDIEIQRQFAVLVAATAKASGVHIHLVAHPKKPMQNGQEPDINDVAGAKEIGGIADNILFVRRGTSDSIGGAGPMKVSVKKQRGFRGEWPTYEGYFHHKFRQFGSHPYMDVPTKYLPDEAYAQYQSPSVPF